MNELFIPMNLFKTMADNFDILGVFQKEGDLYGRAHVDKVLASLGNDKEQLRKLVENNVISVEPNGKIAQLDNVRLSFFKSYFTTFFSRRGRKRMLKRIKKSSDNFMRDLKKIVVFDVETSGLNAGENGILSLSWQVLDADLEKVAEESRFFDWPEDESQVTMGAININGLTKERLAELGTTDEKTALREFAEVVATANLLVTDNGWFDFRFVTNDAKNLGIEIDLNKPQIDVLKWSSEFLSDFGWPSLCQLAEILHVDTDGIHWHQSASDVEVTARCFRTISKMGMAFLSIEYPLPERIELSAR